MNFLLWLIDKISDIIAPYFVSHLRDSLKKRPIKTSLFLLGSTFSIAAIGSILTVLPYFPIPFFEQDKPLRLSNSSRARHELKHVNEHLIYEAKISQGDDPMKSDPNVDAWAYANIMIGLGPDSVRERLKHDHLRYFRNRMKTGSNCWIQFRNESGDPCHTGATSWVLNAMATNSIQPSKEMWSYLLGQQGSKGWWSLYEDSTKDNENASTYSTAVALWALEAGLKHQLIQKNLVEKATNSAMKARSWLMAKREKDCLWSAYPDRPSDIEPSVTISTFVVYVLMSTNPNTLQDLTEECLDKFTKEQLLINDDMYVSGEIIKLNDGSNEKDSVRHQKLIWKILALSKLYPHMSLTGKSQIRKYVDNSLFPDSTSPESGLKHTFQKGEFALMIRSIL